MCRFVLPLLLAATAAPADLRITIYDRAQMPGTISRATFALLADVFRNAGIRIETIPGDLHAEEASLLIYVEPPRPGTEQLIACRARRDVALEILGSAPPFRKASLLGMAEPLAPRGINARVFADRLQDAAARENRDYSTVLAYSIAHEIGHVLLRTHVHETAGLMSAVWGEREYAAMLRRSMYFSPRQARVMRDVLEGADCR